MSIVKLKNIPNKVKINIGYNGYNKDDGGFLVAVREIDFRLKNNEIKIYF